MCPVQQPKANSPWEDRPRPLYRRVAGHESGLPELRLVAKLRGAALRRGPHARDNDRENEKYLSDQELRGGQGLLPAAPGASRPQDQPGGENRLLLLWRAMTQHDAARSKLSSISDDSTRGLRLDLESRQRATYPCEPPHILSRSKAYIGSKHGFTLLFDLNLSMQGNKDFDLSTHRSACRLSSLAKKSRSRSNS